MIRAVSPALLLLALHPVAGSAAPLYLGEQEFDTDDRASIEAIMKHCTGLDQPREQAASTDAGQTPEGGGNNVASEVGSGFEGALTGADTDILASNGQEASDREPPDLSGITAEHCRAAGIIH